MARLIESKPPAGAAARTFDLPGGEAAVIGRSATKCNVVVPDAAVSGIHATMSRGPDAFLLKDLASTNGTTLNGEPVEADRDVKVYRGDEIRFGDNDRPRRDNRRRDFRNDRRESNRRDDNED